MKEIGKNVKVGVISLGCSKNRVDTELMLGYLSKANYTITNDPAEARVLIVNTCGFIESAKQESINAILELAEYKESGNCVALVVTGCLVQRYLNELAAELPEVDIWLGVREYETLVPKLRAYFPDKSQSCTIYPWGERVLTTPAHYAFLRVSDGCDNRCTYCAIPGIRGKYKSRTIDEIVSEANALVKRGAVELNVIAQDTTRFGLDTHGKKLLPELLTKLERTDAKWLRILYAYPDELDDRILDAIDNSNKVVKYIDLPLQHADDAVLKAMNRRGSSEEYAELIEKIRSKNPDYILRTTYMVGFPGETEANFVKLLDFVQEHPFDRMGAFMYSPEEGTPSADLDDNVPKHEKKRRLDALMKAQRQVAERLAKRRIGSVCDVLVEGFDKEAGIWFGRSYGEAAEIDGLVYFRGLNAHNPGEFAKVKITKAVEHDLMGEELK